VRCDYSVEELTNILHSGNISVEEFTLSGRVRFIRNHGGIVFLTLIENGRTLQVVIERAAVGAQALRLLGQTVDTGDILLITGSMGTSRNGTVSVLASDWRMVSKCLHPIPFDSFTDPEARLRRRSTDLLVNPEQVQNLRMRSAIITSIRRTLDTEGFTEVETPILNTVHGGASARPFKTFINAYGA
ncbi:MAG: lysine--tRNA ligase, partial [Rothia dentocariosa]|nr:lysine--tRNA ligase [Rothia dentocariosa]